jgi:hypothetical protein
LAMSRFTDSGTMGTRFSAAASSRGIAILMKGSSS